VQYKPQVSQRVDTAALKGKYPDIYAAVVKPSVSRPFRVFPA
jgi:predicted phage-related endonuclease